MERDELKRILEKQRAFFATGVTLDPDYRTEALYDLRKTVLDCQGEIAAALREDLGKSEMESYMCETGMLLSEIDWQIRHVDRLSKNARKHTPLAQFAAKSYVHPEPLGNVLVMSPWNYPLLLSLEPAVDAIAAGNTVVIKPSAYSPASSRVVAEIVETALPEDYAAVVTGGREENAALLEEKWDKIFFTGSKTVGRTVLEKAAKHLTPCTLELGGKSPCIVDQDAKIELAARRIVFGKFLNCGQTCVAPDYVFVHKSVANEFVDAVLRQVKGQFGDYLENKDYGKIINEKHFDRIASLIDPEKTAYGGRLNKELLKIEPTVMVGVTPEDAVMQQEIFGPILPILEYEYTQDVIEYIDANEKPLALYVFTENEGLAKYIVDHVRYGGGCINDVIIHLANSSMGFGGVGESGMGSYHGKAGFDCFTHQKSIVDKKTWIDLNMRYQPYKKSMQRLVKLFLR
ncbi:MAG: aldehyde dehydrogenase [Firmicutes bacterium]|nr:aldehyde dehydrogenase [Bacillota bacterium]